MGLRSMTLSRDLGYSEIYMYLPRSIFCNAQAHLCTDEKINLFEVAQDCHQKLRPGVQLQQGR